MDGEVHSLAASLFEGKFHVDVRVEKFVSPVQHTDPRLEALFINSLTSDSVMENCNKLFRMKN